MTPYIMPTLTHYRGGVWESAFHVGPITSPPSNPALSCRMQFRHRTTRTLGYEFNNTPAVTQGTITIVNANTYEFDFPDPELPLDSGTWDYDFETFETDDLTGTSRTWFTGTVVVPQDISHD